MSKVESGDLAKVSLRERIMESKIAPVALGAIPFVLVVVLWHFYSQWQPEGLRTAIPTLSDTWDSVHRDLESGVMGDALWVTIQEFAYGLLIAIGAGVIIGVVIGLSPIYYMIVYPIIVFFQAVPKVALAPLLIIVFGFGMGSKIAVASALAFFPILVGVVQGMRTIRHDEIELMRSMTRSRWELFRRVRVPRAVPATFAGIQVAAVFALVGAVVTEFVGSSDGVGFLIQVRSSQLDIAGVYSAILALSAVGVAIALSLAWVGNRLNSWEE